MNRNYSFYQMGRSCKVIHESVLAGSLQAIEVESHSAHETGGDPQTSQSSRSSFEQRLLSFLHVFVVGQGQTLDGSEQRDLAADQPGCFPADQLQRVWILFLRHGAAAGGVSLRQLDKAVLLRGKQY